MHFQLISNRLWASVHSLRMHDVLQLSMNKLRKPNRNRHTPNTKQRYLLLMLSKGLLAKLSLERKQRGAGRASVDDQENDTLHIWLKSLHPDEADRRAFWGILCFYLKLLKTILQICVVNSKQYLSNREDAQQATPLTENIHFHWTVSLFAPFLTLKVLWEE